MSVQRLVRGRRTGGIVLLLALCCPALSAESPPDVQVVALFKDRAMLSIGGRQRMLKTGETSPEGITLLSSDSEQARIEVDGQSYTLHVSGRITGTFSKRAAGQLRLYPDPNGHYHTKGGINGVGVSFLVDTGATYISLNAVEAERIGIDYRRGKREYVQTAANVVEVYVVLLDRVRVGSIEKRNIRATVVPDSSMRIILLGNSFLNLFNIHRESDYLELIEK